MISWLESTTGAQSIFWTSSDSGSNAASADANSVARTGSNKWTYFANFSRTSTSVVNDSTFDQVTNSTTAFIKFSQSGQTVITNIDSSYASNFYNGFSRSSYVESSSVLSTRSITTSTTGSYAATISTTQTATRSISRWTTSASDAQQPPVFYTSTQSAPSTRTVSTATTKIRDETTENGDTEIHYGLDNTIWQCRTSDWLAEVAWTAPNIFTLTAYAASAMPSAGSVTRWTESRNMATIAATNAEISQFPYESPPVQTVSFPALTSEIPYTTTVGQTWQKTINSGNLFPVVSTTTQATRQITESSISYLTHYNAATFTTQQNLGFYNIDDDTADIVPTITAQEWFHSRKTYTTGNGSISWHEFADAPATRSRTTQYSTAGPGNQIAPDYAPLLLYRTSGSFADRGTFGAQGASIAMGVSAQASAGLTTNKPPAVSRDAFGLVGSALGSSIGALIDLNIGKTFFSPNGLSAYQHREASQTTVFPATYSILDTAGQWVGTLSVNSISVSATFAPTNTGQSRTTTSGQFSTLYPAHTSFITGKANLIGGKMVEGETFYAKWPSGVFANLSTTISSTASVVSQAGSIASSWVEPIVGIVVGTEVNSRTVVSYTQLRNATLYPPPA